jgi:hypothetical protein
MSVLTFISRRIRVIGRPKHTIFPPAQPANMAWQPPPRPVLARGNWQRRTQRRSLLYPVPNVPPAAGETFGGGTTKFLHYNSRRIRTRRQPHQYTTFATPPPPVGFVARPNKLQKVRRRKFFVRPHTRFDVFSTPAAVVTTLPIQPTPFGALGNFGLAFRI